MQPTNNNQLFYVYTNDGQRIGVKDRYSIHRDGDWHRGVQLNLVCEDQLLMQQRSDLVDIAKGLFDQSLATQLVVEDEENDLIALSRGLREELSLNIESLCLEHIAGPKKVIKRYKYDTSLYNREFVSLYQASLPLQDLTPTHSKVQALFWKPIKEVKIEASNYPHKFTQTFLMWLKEVM